jgi:hypothetical protein
MTQKATSNPGTVLPASPRSRQTATPANPDANGPNTANSTAKFPARGTHYRLSAKLLDTLCADFEAHGADAVRSCREEQPQGYLRLIAGLLPKEIDFNDNPLKDLLDGELDILFELARERVAASLDAASLGAASRDEGNKPPSR